VPYPQFDRSKLKLLPLAERNHDMTVDHVLPLDAPLNAPIHHNMPHIAERIVAARRNGKPVIFMMGAHVIKSGASRFVIDLIERGLITHVAMNGAGPIHDFELAMLGASTERVAHYISVGQFGLWQETGFINDIVRQGLEDGCGYGESVGRAIAQSDYPYRHLSILGAAYQARVPVTVHIGLGYDIIHEHPNCDGAALGAASYTDFLVFTRAIEDLDGGVMLCFGSAVMGPEVYLKALSMARNVAHQEGRTIAKFTTAVFDLYDVPEDYHSEAPKDDPRYYYRPFKTMLVRTVKDGGESFYVQGDHRDTVAALHHCIGKV
jgi:hypothetical protein